VISRANAGVVQEAIRMSKSAITLEQVFEEVGWIAKWEARGETRGREAGRLEVAKNLVNNIGLPPEKAAEATGLDLETVKSLLSNKSTQKKDVRRGKSPKR
jgi:predicted transposase YdaD